MRIKITVGYDGTEYCGWQIQPNGDTVQEEIEKALKKLTGEDIRVTGSGRTDSGVHATGQVAHFDTNSSVPPEKFKEALNALLPPDIKIFRSEEVGEGFHARFSAKKKTYIYKMYPSDCERPTERRYAVRIRPNPDIAAMDKAAGYLVGEHDFKCFLSSDSSVESTVRTVFSAKVYEEGDGIAFEICGNGFLYNMVRIIAGTLVAVGEGNIPPEEMKEIISSGDRKRAGKTMPPEGLTLKSVEYP
ncbi:MAG: tRNA pseudouridine(38-40) synthase TruA [Clostridia bacterium]|nr:tRNA pseudouridine(38-40) synthase TruA [Clostridia bacterium]